MNSSLFFVEPPKTVKSGGGHKKVHEGGERAGQIRVCVRKRDVKMKTEKNETKDEIIIIIDLT